MARVLCLYEEVNPTAALIRILISSLYSLHIQYVNYICTYMYVFV